MNTKQLKWLKFFGLAKSDPRSRYEFFLYIPTEFAVFDLEGRYVFANAKYIPDKDRRD